MYASERRGDQDEGRRDEKLADLAKGQGVKLQRAREGLQQSASALKLAATRLREQLAREE